MTRGQVVVCIEPSERLSGLLGFPYFIEKRFPVGELLRKGVVSEDDIDEMKQGKEICKQIAIKEEENHDNST